MKSGQPKPVLKQVWTICDVQQNGYLERNEFNLALRLIAMAQRSPNLELTLEHLSRFAGMSLIPDFTGQDQAAQGTDLPDISPVVMRAPDAVIDENAFSVTRKYTAQAPPHNLVSTDVSDTLLVVPADKPPWLMPEPDALSTINSTPELVPTPANHSDMSFLSSPAFLFSFFSSRCPINVSRCSLLAARCSVGKEVARESPSNNGTATTCHMVNVFLPIWCLTSVPRSRYLSWACRQKARAGLRRCQYLVDRSHRK